MTAASGFYCDLAACLTTAASDADRLAMMANLMRATRERAAAMPTPPDVLGAGWGKPH